MSRILPILFNTEMVQAILDNRKTVTRRIIKPSYRPDESGFKVFTNMGTKERWAEKIDEEEMSFDPPRYVTPPFQSGDILYIRETWRVGYWDVRNQTIAFDYKDGVCGKPVYISDRDLFERLVNQSREDARKAKCEYNGADFIWKKGKSPCRWRPSIHMPKAAARIWLRVTDIKIQRLQEITIEDIRSEGLSSMAVHAGDMEIAIQEWKILWDSTIPKGQQALYGWNANPWVTATKFEHCKT